MNSSGTRIALAALAGAGLIGAGVGIGAAASRSGGTGYPTAGTMMNGYGMMNGAGSMMGGAGMMQSGGMMNGMMYGGSMMGGAATSVPPAIEGAISVTVTTDNLSFSPASLTTTLGQALNVTVRNTDEIVHDMTIPAFGVHAVVQPGQSVTFGIRPTSAGTYPFLCTVAGHAQAGMRGVLTVTL